jgi:hypothetical protein
LRVPLPFLPFAVSIVAGVERRQRTPWRWQMRLRTLFVLVAIAAVVMAGVAAWQRRQRWLRWQPELENRTRSYLADAAMYARAESSYLKAAASGKTSTIFYCNSEGWVTLRLRGAELGRVAKEKGRLRLKYEHAAAHPWLSIEPDPSPNVIDKLVEEKGLVHSRRVPPEVARRRGVVPRGTVDVQAAQAPGDPGSSDH